MYVYGGMYIDLDTVCNEVFILDENVNIMLGSTGMIDSFILNNFFSINNNIILSIPKHPFWESILHRINTSSIPEILPKIIYIFLHTGPYMLQNAYENYPDKKDITIYKTLSVGVHKSNTYFQHISKKSWVDVFDAVYLGYFLFIIIIFSRIVLKILKYFFLFIL
jgi:mannosyltransferase OCH1-like enzyme